MISKQDFLGNVRIKILPSILRKTEEEKLPTILMSHKKMIICCLVLLFFIACFLSYQKLALMSGFSILGEFIFVFWYKKRINRFVKEQVFSLLDLEEKHLSVGNLVELAKTGVLPNCNDAETDDSFILKNTKHALFVQETELSKWHGKHRHIVFHGLVISSDQFHLPNVSVLLWDKCITKSNLAESFNRFFSKLFEKEEPWEKVNCSDEKLEKEYDIYAPKFFEADKILTSQFTWGLNKIKSIFGEPMNLLIDNGEIVLAIPLKKNSFECINWKNYSDLSSYEKFYDEIQKLNMIDDALFELESKY